MEINYRDAGVRDEGSLDLPLAWGCQADNFGDYLSPILVQILSGKVVQESKESFVGKRLFAIGTLLHCAINDSVVWGSGIRERNTTAKRLTVHAVRGPLTRKLLMKRGISCPTVFGDPALLFPLLYRPQVRKEHPVGVVCHFDDPSGLKNVDAFQIDVLCHPLKVIDQILKCKRIISSSLHGIIIAESYGIPACWAFPKMTFTEEKLKYRDYYASTGRKVRPLICKDIVDIGKTRFEPLPQIPYAKLELLLSAFPFLRKGIKNLEDLNKFRIHDVHI